MNLYNRFIKWIVFKMLKKHGVEIDGMDNKYKNTRRL